MDNKSVVLSIIIPVYNGRNTIENCLRSVLNQISISSEVIVVDDGSTDNTSDICANICHKDNRVVLIQQENGGVSSARNTGIAAASGRYIMFIDSDDILAQGYFDAFLNITSLLEQKIIVLSRMIVHYLNKDMVVIEGAELDTETILSKDRIVDIWDNHLWNSPVNKIYRSDIIKNNNIEFNPNVKIGEDWLFNNSYARAFEPEAFYIIEKAAYDYYLDKDPWRHCKKEEFYEINKKQVNDFKDTLNKLNVSREATEMFDKRDLDFTISEIRRVARDKYSFIGKIQKIRKLMAEENVNKRVLHNRFSYPLLDWFEISFGNALFIIIWENTRKNIGLLKRKINE